MQSVYRLAVLHSHPIQYFAPLFRRLAQEPGIDLTVYYCSKQGAAEYTDPGFGQRFKWDIPLLDGYKHRFLPNLRGRDAVGGFLSLINPSIVAELRKGRYDALLVHGHNHATYLLGIIAAKLLRIPVLMRCETHLLLRRSAIKSFLRRPVMSFFYRHLCSACLPIGTRNREFYRFHGVPDRRLFMVPYTVDNDFFIQEASNLAPQRNAIRADLGLPVDKPLILFVAKIVEQKRPHDLLLAYHELRNRDIDAALVFVGSGAAEESLKSHIAEHGIADVYFMGFRNQTEMPKFFALADIFVLPSDNETWGLVVNEAMCAGLPVISTAEIGVTADLVKPGYNGFVFRAGDVEQLTEHLSALASNAELRVRMSAHSRQLIQDWDYDACVRGVVSALKAVRGSSKPRGKRSSASELRGVRGN